MIRIALYKGVSLISILIRMQTRSVYSHAACLLDDDSAIEAWNVGGVRHIKTLLTGHKPQTDIDVYHIAATQAQQECYEKFLHAQVGKKYDFRSVFRFLTKYPAVRNNKWFCSELVMAACAEAGITPLLRVAAEEVSPAMLSYSPLLNKYQKRKKK